MSLSILLHRAFVESLKNLAQAECDSVRRMLNILTLGDITPGMRPHFVGSFLSLSPNMDLRVIALREASSLTLLYVDHHNAAYRWAENRTVLAESRSFPELIPISAIRNDTAEINESAEPLPIPAEEVLSISNSDDFLEAISEMSPEWQEWLFNAYGSGERRAAPPVTSSLVFSPIDDKDLERALQLDIESWELFLHPKQQEAVNDNSPSMAVVGGPGSGKTVILLRRIIECSPKGRDSDCSVLLTCIRCPCPRGNELDFAAPPTSAGPLIEPVPGAALPALRPRPWA